MPFVLIILGVVLLITSIRNTYGLTTPQGTPGLGALVQKDFTGPGNFIYWLLSLFVIGAIGYIPKLKPISTALLALVILVLILTKGNPQSGGGGFFSQFTQQIGTTTQAQAQPAQQVGTVGAAPPVGAPGYLGSLIPSLPSISPVGAI